MHECYRYYAANNERERTCEGLYHYDDSVPQAFKERVAVLDAARNENGYAHIPGVGVTTKESNLLRTVFHYYL
jgi:hypothetical protein